MVLTVNIGNTHITIGGYEEGALSFCGRLSTAQPATQDEYAMRILNLIQLYHVPSESVEGAIVGSVVPAVTSMVRGALEQLFHVRVRTIGPGLKSGLPIRIDNPAELGAELLCGAVAALRIHKPPLVVIHTDTACSMMAINAAGQLVGGVIAAGPNLALNTLVKHASQLPHVDASVTPKSILATNTAECLQNGAVLGTAAMIDGLMARFTAELGPETCAIATGQFPENIRSACSFPILYQPTLILDGLYAIWLKNKK